MKALTLFAEDPARLGWPGTLPIEIAMRTATLKDILEGYRMTRHDWERLRHNPVFIKAVIEAQEELSKEGMGFKMKARLQAEQLLETAFGMIHEPDEKVVPANVKADLIKFTIRAAGLDGSKDQGQGGQVGTALQININL
jgi:hypothetical protein